MPRSLDARLALRNRSGRVIALCRLALASVFFIALWIDPEQPVRSSTLGYAILGSYFLVSLLLLWIAWASWWHDFGMATLTHVLDVMAFLVAIYFTEGAVSEFTSPFLAFFAFLMLSATIRWGWRRTVITGLVVTALYFLVGVAMSLADYDFDRFRFGRRVTYMAVLGIVLVWFGAQRQRPAVARMPQSLSREESTRLPLRAALHYAMRETNAERGAIFWSDGEEPGIEVEAVGLEPDLKRLTDDEFVSDSVFGEFPRLFDREKSRKLTLPDGPPKRDHHCEEEALATVAGVADGLAIPYQCVLGRGEIYLADIPGMAVDDLEVARAICVEIGASFDRHATMALSQQALEVQLHERIARDLHDTVAQSLAAVGLQLEGLRRFIAQGGNPEPEIQAIKRALHNEQRQVRSMIGQLRAEKRRDGAHIREGSDPFASLSRELYDAWKVELNFEIDPKAMHVESFRHQLKHLLREAVANAVRHGKATRLDAIGTIEESVLTLAVCDNGGGFPPSWDGHPPRSLAERVAEMQGTINVDSHAQGSTLVITLPLSCPA